jgi:phosphatidylserine/phosphatidylglycerophosphate/cardiolipin synthase-like enzyme
MEQFFSKLVNRPAPRVMKPGLMAALVLATLLPHTAAAQDQILFPAVDNAHSLLIQKINAEAQRLDIATWYLADWEFTLAIERRHRGGVPVRLIGDRGALFEADPFTREQFEYLAKAGVPIKLRYHPNWVSEIIHWKAGIFVGQKTVEFGSANWTTDEFKPFSSTNFKDETAMFTSDPALFQAFASKFDQYWNDKDHFLDWAEAYKLETGQTWTAPMNVPQGRLEPDVTDPPGLIWGQGPELHNPMIAEIDRETNGVDIVIYRLTVGDLTNALIRKHQSGVPVRVIVEPTQYRNTLYPEYWMTGTMVDLLWKAGIPIKIRRHQGLTHMKTLITSKVALNASSNFTRFWERDHNYFISAATKPAIHQAFKNRFNAMWNDTTNFGPFDPLRPQEPTQLKPANGGTNVTTAPTLEWNRARWAVNYDVYIGTSPGSLALAGRVDAVISETPPETYTFKPTQALLPSTTYFWRVVSRTYATDVRPDLVAASEIWSFTTAAGSTPPGGGGSGPFNGTAVSLPGTVQAENFDNGGIGVAYQDTSAGNSGGAYRTTDVDIEGTADTGGGYNVGWLDVGEWLKYSVNVTTAGTYNIEFRVAAPSTGGKFHLEINDVAKTGQLSIPSTGSWQTWTTVTATGVSLAAGPQVWKVVFDSATAGTIGNFNYLRVVSGGGTTPTSPTITTSSPLPGGTVGSAYNQTLTATGGTPPYSGWTVTAGALPAGLTLNASTGAITGTPTTAGTSAFTVRVSDAAARQGTKDLSLTIATSGGGGGGTGTWGDGIGVSISGSTVTRSAPTADTRNASALSVGEMAGDGSFSFRIVAPGITTVGFGTNPGNELTGMTHRLDFYPNDFVYRDANGAYLGESSYSLGDTFKLQRVGSTVTLYRNGTLVPVSWSASSGTKRIDVAIATQGAGITLTELVGFTGSSTTTPPPPPPPPPSSAAEIVIYGADIPVANLHGNWGRINDTSAAAGIAISSTNLNGATVTTPIAAPNDYVDVTFTAQAGVRYRLWMRIRAAASNKFNDSLWVQFNGSVNSGGSPTYRIGTTQALNVNLATCADCAIANWGWQNRAYWEADTGEVWFSTTGTQIMRIQIREDGVVFDQIVLSPAKYIDAAPGPTTNDTTIVAK